MYQSDVKKYRNNQTITVVLALGFLFALVFVFPNNASAITKSIGSDKASLQFAAGNHVLGFQPDSFIVAGTDHVLKVAFVDAKPVAPRAPKGRYETGQLKGRAQPLESVTYQALWPGVSLVFDSTRGLMESFYHIAPQGSLSTSYSEKRPVDLIRLRYSVPVSLDKDGNLVLKFQTGQMRESAPVAWQEINGRRVPVPVSFQIVNRYELGFKVVQYNPAYPLVIDPVMSWNSFINVETGSYQVFDVALDTDRNIYVVGYSNSSWGNPIVPFQGSRDVFIAKFDNSGNLLWNTFLGSGYSDGTSIVIDPDDKGIYVAGVSDQSWGNPLAPYQGDDDVFVAKIKNDGIDDGKIEWHTFMGSADSWENCYDIALDGTDKLLVQGASNRPWGEPIYPMNSRYDIFVAQLNRVDGKRNWHTFMGSSGSDRGCGLAVGKDGSIYVGGYCYTEWGSPVKGDSGDLDVYAVKLDKMGKRLWNTFIGGQKEDYGDSIAVDKSGNVYISGRSLAAWGDSPVNGDGGDWSDAFVAKLDTNGNFLWNTFLGSASSYTSSQIALDDGGDPILVGYCESTWGEPTNPYTDETRGFVGKLDKNGNRLWNTFMMGVAGNYPNYALAVDTQDNMYIAGYSNTSWGAAPMNAHSGGSDLFVVKLEATYKLTINVTGIGSGSVTSTIDGIDCDPDCIKEYDKGTVVTLRQQPDEGMVFSSWSGVGCAGTGDCTTTMEADRIIRAHFNNPSLDTDGDGIIDMDEQGPLGNDPMYDGNEDGAPDWWQNSVVSSPTKEGSGYVTFNTPECKPSKRISIRAANILEQPPYTELPPGVDFDWGLFEYVFNPCMHGDEAIITLRLEEGAVTNTYYMFGPTPDNPVDHWYKFLYDGKTGAEINGNVITLHFIDGLRGDSDLDSTNFTIADPGGPGFSGEDYLGFGSGDDSGSVDASCFINGISKR